MKALQLELDLLTRASEDLFAHMVKRAGKDTLEVFSRNYRTHKALGERIRKVEALIEEQRPLAQWERELLGI